MTKHAVCKKHNIQVDATISDRGPQQQVFVAGVERAATYKNVNQAAICLVMP
jgi:hypothetical protein